MVALLCLIATFPPTYQAWPRIDANPLGLLVAIDRRQGLKFVATDAALANIKVQGPRGLEKAVVGPSITGPGIMAGAALLKVERSPDAGWRTVTVSLSGLPSTRYPGGNTTWLRYYLPAESTVEEDARLRSQWVGRNVWLLGSAVASGEDTLLWDPRLPVKIVDIKRLASPILDQCDNPVWDGTTGWNGGSFCCANPLQLTIALPKGAWRLVNFSQNANFTNPESRIPLPDSAQGTIVVADEWHLKRVVSTESPSVLLSKESPQVQAAFATRDVVKGMPRRLIALLMGDPEPSAPAEEVWKRKEWEWHGGVFGYGFWFDREGRLTGYGSFGDLP